MVFFRELLASAFLQGSPKMTAWRLLCLHPSCFYSLVVKPVGGHGRKQSLDVCIGHGLFSVDISGDHY